MKVRFAVLAAVATVAALADSAGQTAPAAKSKSSWQLFPGTASIGYPVLAFG